jgi:hypothetical protein
MEINPKELDKTLRACVDKSGRLLYLKLVGGTYWKTIELQHVKNCIRAAYPGADASMFLASKIEYWHLAVGSDPGTPLKRTMRYGPTVRGPENKNEYLRIFVANNFQPSSKPLRRTSYSWKHVAEQMSGEYHYSEDDDFAVACRACGIRVDDDGTIYAREIP